MEYVQMTLNDWVEMKKKLRQELLGVKQSFVRIGYALRQIDDQKLYEQDGYKSIAEFAKEEYGLEPSTTSRFMSINREYSIDGYSELLRPEYEDLGRSQLEEMLKLPESDRQMIQPETSREDIRDLKRFNKANPETGVADDLRQLVEKFFYDNPEILNTVFREPGFEEETIKRFTDMVNPGGNRSYRKGLYFMMMYENRVAVKKVGTDPQNLTWWEFWKITEDIFGEAAAGPKTWQNYFGEEEKKEDCPVDRPNADDNKTRQEGDIKAAEPVMEQKEASCMTDKESAEPEAASADADRDVEKEEELSEEKQEKEPVAPAQKSGETPVNTSAETESDASEEMAEPEEPAKITEPEVMDKPFGTRKDYFDTLTAYGLADYLYKSYIEDPEEFQERLGKIEHLEEWLKEEVDDQGKKLEDER